jgi:hypothetical protein
MINAPKRCNNGGYASGLERDNGLRLEKQGVTFWYESGPCEIHYTMKVRKGKCGECGESKNIVTEHLYTCDFVFVSKSGKHIYVECKGHPLAWNGKARSKHQAIKKQFPEMDLRFVFNNKHAKISKGSKTTNAEWCKRQGFECASGLIPLKWLEE